MDPHGARRPTRTAHAVPGSGGGRPVAERGTGAYDGRMRSASSGGWPRPVRSRCGPVGGGAPGAVVPGGVLLVGRAGVV